MRSSWWCAERRFGSRQTVLELAFAALRNVVNPTRAMPVLRVLFAIALFCGCAGQESREDEVQARGPLPYQVGVYLDTESLPYRLPAIDPDSSRVQYRGRDEQILNMVQDALIGDEPVVSHVVILEANTKGAALGEARGLDLLLGVGFETVDEFSEYSPSAAWGTLEILTFICGGIPSWFVPTVSFETPALLAVGVVDLHQPHVREWYNDAQREGAPDFDWSDAFKSTEQQTSFWERSTAFTDYLLVLLIPPMLVVPGQIDRVSETLTAGINQDLAGQLAAALRDRLLSEDWVKPLTVVFLEPDPMALLEGDTMTLRVSLANRQGGDLRRLEVVRLAPRADDYRWEASPEELRELSDRFASLEDPNDYVPFEITGPIPVADGANLVKIRLVHESGEQIVRTQLYVR